MPHKPENIGHFLYRVVQKKSNEEPLQDVIADLEHFARRFRDNLAWFMYHGGSIAELCAGVRGYYQQQASAGKNVDLVVSALNNIRDTAHRHKATQILRSKLQGNGQWSNQIMQMHKLLIDSDKAGEYYRLLGVTIDF